MQNLLYQTWRKRDRYQHYLWVNIPFVATYIFKILRKWKLRLRYTTAQLITINPTFSADYAHRFPPTVRCNPSCYRAKIPEQYFLQNIHLFLSFCHRTVIGHSTIAMKRASTIDLHVTNTISWVRIPWRCAWRIWRPHGDVYPPRRSHKVQTDRYVPKAPHKAPRISGILCAKRKRYKRKTSKKKKREY